MYESDEDILAAGQTIVYCVHEKVGHLGIFVSSGVAKKEHEEFATNIDLIDCLPPGLYEAVIRRRSPEADNPELIVGDYISSFEARSLEDIRALGGNTLEEDRCFATVARLSQVTNGLYRISAQPLVRSLATEQMAEWSRRMNPQRLKYELVSDRNPAARSIADMAQEARNNRRQVRPGNPFLQWEKIFSEWMTLSLNAYREWRDMLVEQTFFGVYGRPWLQALLGLKASDDPPRHRPGRDPEHVAFVEQRIEDLRAKMDKGGPREAALRAMLYVCMPEKKADERAFEMLRQSRAEHGANQDLPEFKEDLREQFYMLRLDQDRAVELIPRLLEGHENEGPKLLEYVRKVVTASGPLNEESATRLAQIKKLLAPQGPDRPLQEGPEKCSTEEVIHHGHQ